MSVRVIGSTQPVKKFACSFEGCQKAYTRPSLLSEHMRSHDNTRPFACEQCDKKFLRESHLKSHRWLHADEKPLGCTQCEKRFITNQQLQRHLQTHERKKARAEKKKAKLDSSLEYGCKVHDGVYYSTVVSSPGSLTTSSSVTDSDSSTNTLLTPATASSTTDISERLPEVLSCPYNCLGVFKSTKALSDHILEGHVFADTLDVDVHLESIKHDLETNTYPYSMDRIIGWDGLDWSEKHCMEVRCQGPCPSYNDFESLIAHYNDLHGFIPDSLFEFIGLETNDAK